ncbi:hypothetical protein NLJ89_g5778 [Agrocybe chaxingu]|uniref:Dienelactone hydrolase domain-containing protein n=1 Tax=Agrocybe chaxingu TaxID=84603 RepID=A0A9W8MX13_9AGAR|nr:hypothetical protein NLJ89_g5778 [Agrocybe chaxingu]
MLKITTKSLLLLSSLALGSVVQVRGVVFGGADLSSPLLAGLPGEDCVKTHLHEGNPVGEVVPLGGMDTYVSVPRRDSPGPKKIFIFFSDIYGPLYQNTKLIQDQIAANGYTVLGPDYFFGDPIYLHDNEPDFDMVAWFNNKTALARAATPLWLEAVKQKYGVNGKDVKYTVSGYCFGAPYALDVAATDDVVAASFAHPSRVTEEQFQKVKR